MPRLTARERRASYEREYAFQKKHGKSFFPHAVFHDTIVSLIVVALIMGMTILWYAQFDAVPAAADAARHGGILGPAYEAKADPGVLRYDPKPEWYFFFLFELLKVLKPPWLTPVATIGIPTLCMVLLLLLPFYDRNPERRLTRRPIAAISGFFVIIAMAYLTFLGANAGSPTEIEAKVPASLEEGKLVTAQSGCLACHQIGENGNNGPGPELTEIGLRLPRATIARSLYIGPGIMPSYAGLPKKKLDALTEYLASLR